MNIQQDSVEILGVKIDRVDSDQSLEQVVGWVGGQDKHYIVTPNLEFLLAAQKDKDFKNILNKADLSIPDSSSLGFGFWLSQRNIFIRFLLWPIFFLPLKRLIRFDILPGADFMETLCKVSSEKGFTVGFLGGRDGVAEKAADCLQKKYKNLEVSFASDGPEVDDDGNQVSGEDLRFKIYDLREKAPKSLFAEKPGLFLNLKSLPSVDILFVAFGQVKQEKWIANNLGNIPVKVAMGVGGSFDYFAGIVPRAPKFLRTLGFEWLFRLLLQPWRIKRQLALAKFAFLIVSGYP